MNRREWRSSVLALSSTLDQESISLITVNVQLCGFSNIMRNGWSQAKSGASGAQSKVTLTATIERKRI